MDRPDPFTISGIQFKQDSKHELTQLEISVVTTNGGVADFKGMYSVVTVDKEAYLLDAASWGRESTNGVFFGDLKTVIRVPSARIQNDAVIAVAIPFLGSAYQSSILSYNPILVDKVVLLQVTETNQVWGILGSGFTSNTNGPVVVTADRNYLPGPELLIHGDGLIALTVPKAAASQVKTLLIKVGSSSPVLTSAPKQTAPKVQVTNSPLADKESAPLIEFQGENFLQLGKVSFGADALIFKAASETNLQVFLSRKVTEKSGRVALVLEAKDGSIVPAELIVK